MTELDSPRQNHLLATLSTVEYQRLSPHLERIAMPVGNVLYEAGDVLRYVYFPTTCVISIRYIMENGASAEIAVVGNEGIVSIALFLGDRTMSNQAMVRNAGYAYRLRAALFTREFNRHNGPLHDLMLRYTQTLLTQIAQVAVCNRHHLLEQQLCRWLLISLDRLNSSELSITQESIANMLGVRREGVTEAAGKLQQAGLIEYHRGHITILNRQGLEARVCECYQTVKAELERLLPSPPSEQSERIISKTLSAIRSNPPALEAKRMTSK